VASSIGIVTPELAVMFAATAPGEHRGDMDVRPRTL